MQATIHNEFLTLTVDTHGAEAVSLKMRRGKSCSGRPTRLCGSATPHSVPVDGQAARRYL